MATTTFSMMETGADNDGTKAKIVASNRYTLRFAALNSCVLYKELFLTYLGAALIEPVLAIAGMEEAVGYELVIDIITLLALCWWIWILSDAFDFSDVMQFYKYRVDFGDPIKERQYDWIEFEKPNSMSERRNNNFINIMKRDIMLWFMFACIAAAWIRPDIIQHRDVMHAYCVVLLWTLMHHACRNATSWGRSYLFTYFFPSTALMPLEYCLPLADVENTVDDLDFVVSYREFVKDQTGVELVLRS